MQAIAIRSEIASASALACRIIDKKIGIPVLSHLALVERGGVLHALATDLDRDLTIALPGSPVDLGFAATVNANALRETEKKAPASDEIAIRAEGGKLRATFGKLAVAMESLPVCDFPDLRMSAPIHADFTLTRDELLAALDAVQFAISKEETRYYLNGVFLCLKRFERGGPVGLRFVATDGHRLAMHDIARPYGWSRKAAPDGGRGVIIPRQSCETLRDLIKAKAGEVFRFEINSVKIRVTVGNVVFITKLIDGTFPDYQRLIPVRNHKTLTMSTGDAIEAVKAVASMSSERGRAVKLTVNDGSATFAVHNPDQGTASQDVSATWDHAPDFQIGFNHRYLLDILERIEGETVSVSLSESGSPSLFRDGVNTFVLMPMRV